MKFNKKKERLGVFVHALNQDGATKVIYEAFRNTSIIHRYSSVSIISPFDGEMIDYFRKIGIHAKVIHYKSIIGKKSFLSITKLKIIYNLYKEIRTFDKILVNSVDQNFILFFLLKKSNRKVILYGHESLYSDSLHFSHFTLADRTTKIIRDSILAKKFILAFPSISTVKNGAQWFGVNKSQVEYLPYGFNNIDLERISSYSDNTYSFIVVGGIGYRKSQYQVIAAFKIVDEIIKKNPEKYRDWTLNIMGIRYSQKESKDFLHHVNQVFCSLKIKYSPFISIEKVQKELIKYHCLLSASLNEALPLNVVEMMQVAGVVIGSNCEGHDELLVDQKTGFIFEKGQVSELAKTILNVLDKTKTSPEKMNDIAFAARSHIHKNYNYNLFENNFYNLNKKLYENNEILIIYISPWNYEARENRSQPLARELARQGYKVLYINFPVGQGRKSRLKERFLKGKYSKVEENLYHSIGGPLLHKYIWKDIRYIQKEFSRKQVSFAKYIRSLMNKSEFKHKQLVLLSNRSISSVVKKYISFDVSIMDIEDPWPYLYEHWELESKESLNECLKQFAKTTEFALANGPQIMKIAYENFYSSEKEIIELPCGVDTNIFTFTSGEKPDDLPSGKKIVIFSGMVDERIDFDLVTSMTKEIHEYNFVFLGAVHPIVLDKVNALQKEFDNIYFLGQKDVRNLSLYFVYASIFIIPYVKEGGWNFTFPAKLFEYMIFGHPIITSFFIEGVPKEYVAVATNNSDFIKILKEKESGDIFQEGRMKFAEENSWQKMAQRLSMAIQKNLEKK